MRHCSQINRIAEQFVSRILIPTMIENSEEIEIVLNNLINELRFIPASGRGFNERYLHHYFSQQLSTKCPIVFGDGAGLHPEWSTSRHGNVLYKRSEHGEYHREDSSNGWSGFIDFVIENHDRSRIGIEFKHGTSINKKGVVFDYQKLLDRDNGFGCIYSFVVCDRRNLSDYRNAAKALKECLQNAKDILADKLADTEAHLWYIEIRNTDILRIECNDITTGEFTRQIVKIQP